MSQLGVEAEGTSRATPEVVWAFVSDATTYASWGPWDESGYEVAGHEPARGVGAIQRFRMGRATSIERILEVDEGRHLAYTVIGGIPVRNYRADVTLTPSDDGTHIRWAATWDPTLLGRIVQRKLRKVYPDVVSRLVAASNERSASQP